MDVKKIEELIEVLQGSRAEELCIHKGDSTVCIKKGKRPVAAASPKKSAKPAQTHIQVKETSPKESYIRAPMVGLFHKAEEISSGATTITKGQVVGTIESMKILNDVSADISGTITEVLVEDGIPVEYGQPLYKIEPS